MFQWISRSWSWFWGQEDLVGPVCIRAKGQFQNHMYEGGDILGYFLENSSQPPIWNSQMSRTFENSSKPKNQIAFFKCILNWVLRQKNSNNLWRSRVSLTGLIHEKKKPDLLLIYILCWCGVCLSVTFCHYANLYIMLMWCLTWQPAPPWIGKLSPKAPELSPLKRPI